MREQSKVELHVHLEGAAPPELIRAMARQKNQDLSRIFDAEGGYRYADFWDFLKVYEAATEVIKTPADFAELTTAVLAEARAHGVVYTEIFISPDFCGGRDLAAWRDYLAAMSEAAESARRTGIDMRAVVTCIRHFGPDKARQTARCAAGTAGDFVVGFGIAGDEKAGQPIDFAWSFDCAREAGLGLTAHAGEWGGPNSVRRAWEDLRVSRIGHGVRAAEDPALVADLARAGVVLEVCPGSNLALGVYPDMARHPIDNLRKSGVAVTVSTDDPPFFHTTPTAEYEALAAEFGWDAAEFRQINRTAVQAAFCDAATKTRLARIFEEPT